VAPSSEPSSPTPESISVAPQGQPASPVTPSNEVREATEWEQGEKALLKKMRDDKEAVEWEKGEAALAKNLHDVEKLKKQMEDAEKRMEKLKEVLDARKEQAKAKLEKVGLGAGVAKGLEAYRKMNPKYKLAIAVALAGASVMTGGATSFLSIGFSAASFASRDYEKDLAQKTKDGEEIKKGRMVAKSLVKGLVLALGTSTVFSLVGDALHMSADSEWMKSLKEHFSSTPATTPPVATEVAPSPLDPNPEVELAPHSDVSMEHVPPTPEDVSPVATEVAPSPLDPNPEVELASQPTPDSGAPSSSDTVASPPSTPEDISPSVDQETAPAPIVESSPTFVADVTSPIDIHHDYIMGPNDNTDSILRRVLATVEESKGMTDEQKMQVIGTFKQEWSTWVSGASTPNWDLKAMQAGVPGTKLEHLNHVADALKTVIVRGNPINLA
jgi:hypothetical protein